MTDGDCACLDILVAYDEHIGNLFELRLTDLVADFLASAVYLNAEALCLELLLDLVYIVEVSVGNGEKRTFR